MRKVAFIIGCLLLIAVASVNQNTVKAEVTGTEYVSTPLGNGLHPALFQVLPAQETTFMKGFFTDPKCNCVGCSTDANGVRYCCYDTGSGIICLPE